MVISRWACWRQSAACQLTDLLALCSKSYQTVEWDKCGGNSPQTCCAMEQGPDSKIRTISGARQNPPVKNVTSEKDDELVSINRTLPHCDQLNGKASNAKIVCRQNGRQICSLFRQNDITFELKIVVANVFFITNMVMH